MKILFLFLTAIVMNSTFSPDSSKVAFTRGNDLYVSDIVAKDTLRLTYDGSELILNGYASWVYFEEIFGRPSKYRAFWWSPDSQKIAWYRFDDSKVPVFPIYSPFARGKAEEGGIRSTRYPLAGDENPSVQVCITDLTSGKTVVAFNEQDDVYYGTPFWGADSKELFVSRMPRRQNHLDLYAVNAADASKRLVYTERSDTWVKWIDGMLFAKKGLYMARDFETGWQQIYFLPFDGSGTRCLTSGENWDVKLLKLDEKKGKLWFTAKRDSRLHDALYCLNLNKKKNNVNILTNPSLYAREVVINEDGSFSADCTVSGAKIIHITNDGYDLYGLLTLPKDFDKTKKYPVIMHLYGGPGTPCVLDFKDGKAAVDKWCAKNGIIYMVVDPRTAGENGRKAVDESFKRLTVVERQDYVAWAKWLQSLPYVDGGHIGVEGFSFGGTTTARLVLGYPEYFHCGIAGGGVYDWHLYDTHYTERYMCKPDENEEGYNEASVLHFVKSKQTSKDYKPYHLKLTHGTGDDNVHFQNTLLLIDALQRAGVHFEVMIYPDALHGYTGRQAVHNRSDNAEFWKRTLFD